MSEIWFNNFNLTKEWVLNNKNVALTKNIVYKGVAIGEWFITQNKIFRLGKKIENGSIVYRRSALTKEKQEMLLELRKMAYTYEDYLQEKWLNNYNLTKEWILNNKDVPIIKNTIYKGVAIGGWFRTQNRIIRLGKRLENGSLVYRSGTLTLEKQKLIYELNEITYTYDEYLQEKWIETYELIKEWKSEHKDEALHEYTVYKNCNIGQWYASQKSVLNNKNEGIFLKRREMINGLFEDEWLKNYELIKEWMSCNKDKSITCKTVYKGKEIGKWYSVQKKIAKNGTKDENGNIKYYGYRMSFQRYELFKEIMPTVPLKFDYNVSILKEYAKHNGRIDKTIVYQGQNITLWLSKIRKIYKNGQLLEDGSIYLDEKNSLSKENVEKIEQVKQYVNDDNWNEIFYEKNVWYKNFRIVVEYIQKNNGIIYNNPVYKGVNIKYFIYFQRMIIKSGKKLEDGSYVFIRDNNEVILTKEQVKMLEDANLIDGDKIQTKRNIWMERYRLLKTFVDLHNRFPKNTETLNGFGICSWYLNQLAIFKKGELCDNGDIVLNGKVLTKEQIELLESLNIRWYTNSRKLANVEITDQNKFQVKRELLNMLKEELIDNKEIDDVKDSFVRKLMK